MKRPTIRSVWRSLALAALVGTPARATVAQAELEGPLNNDTFVPTQAPLLAQLAKGDDLLWQARQSQGNAASLLARAMDAWQQALVQSNGDEWIAGLDPEGFAARIMPQQQADLARLFLSVPEAVALRLFSLTPDERATWRERFEPLAEQNLALAPQTREHLAILERCFPGTEAAAIACLRLADDQLEAGSRSNANTYLGRALRHLGERAERAPWPQHLVSRGYGPTPPPKESGPSGTLFAAGAWRLESRAGRLAPGERIPLGRGPRPGALILEDGTIVVQTSSALFTLNVDDEGTPLRGFPKLEDLSTWTHEGAIFPMTPPSSGGWPHLPVQLGNRLFLVVDRARAGSDRFDLPIPPRSNHLLALDRRPGGVTELAWHRSSSGLANGTSLGDDQAEPRGHFEYQPGPLLCDGTFWVIARSLASQASEDADLPSDEFLELFGFRSTDGVQVHRLKLHKASDLAARDENSLAQAYPTACQPLGFDTEQGQLIVQTNQGLVGIVDVADGRPRFLFALRRRAPREPGWPGSYRPMVYDQSVWITPMDSDRTYALDLDRTHWPLAKPGIEERGNRIALAAWDERGRTFLARRGARQTLWTEGPQGERALGLLLGIEETLSGMPWISGDKILLTTSSGFYRLDRTQDLRLDLRVALDDRGAGLGGEVLRAGKRVWIVGADTLWLLIER